MLSGRFLLGRWIAGNSEPQCTPVGGDLLVCGIILGTILGGGITPESALVGGEMGLGSSWNTSAGGVRLDFPFCCSGEEGEQCGEPPAPKEKCEDWQVTQVKESDRVKLSPQKDELLVEIASQSGIGRAVIERVVGPWPKKVRIRLYLRGLESLRLQAGPWGLEASVMSYPPYKTRVRVHGPEPIPPQNPQSPFWTEVKMLDAQGKPVSKVPLEKGGYFEVVLPPAWLEKSPPKLEIHWIDFYRD